jgi:predicted dehydrogenase
VQKVNWGIIGLGKIALKFSEGFKNIDNAKLLGISSKDNKKLKKFKEDFKIENNFCFNNYENLLECKDIDIIYIALPNSLHHEWIIKCIEKEKKILVEKPATLNFSQMKDVQNKLLNKNLLFTEAFMYRYHPQIIKVIKLIRENAIGKLISMESFFGMDILTKKNLFGFKKIKKLNKDSRLYNKDLGGGAILDLGCYPVSISQLIASLIPDIDCNNIKVLNKKKEIGSTGVDIDSYAELQFDNKFKSNIGASFTKNLGKETRIVGEKGELLIENTWHADPSIIKIKGEKSYEINVKCNENIFSYEIGNISKSVLENKKETIYPGMSLVETLLNMKILDEWLND